MSYSTVTSEIWQDQFLEAISTDLFQETLAEKENDISTTKSDDISSNRKLKTDKSNQDL